MKNQTCGLQPFSGSGIRPTLTGTQSTISEIFVDDFINPWILQPCLLICLLINEYDKMMTI